MRAVDQFAPGEHKQPNQRTENRNDYIQIRRIAATELQEKTANTC